MYLPRFRQKRNGVPILRREDIDYIAEQYIRDFCPEVLTDPRPVDVDLFAQDYLGLQQDFQYLSNCGLYLGMMVFNDTGKVPVYDPERNRAEYVSEKAGTIVIDRTLLADEQERRYRFTMGHEVGHAVFHGSYYGYDPNQISVFDFFPGVMDQPAMIQCRIDKQQQQSGKVHQVFDDHDWMEWHANNFASSFLMPASAVRYLVENSSTFFSRYQRFWGEWMIEKVALTFNTSWEASQIRLKQLGYVDLERMRYGIPMDRQMVMA